MMEGPTLSSHQYAVLMADGATGHVYKTDGNICRNDEGDVFLVFNALEAAESFVNHKQNENDTLEFAIYNSNNECILHLEAKKWKR